jgi:hypothetical protein
LVGLSPSPLAPTVQTLRTDSADTLTSDVPPPTWGLATRLHVLPFHISVRLVPGPHPQPLLPTAHALLGEIAVTPDRKSARPVRIDGLGEGTRFHSAPFQWRIRLRPFGVAPTAQASRAESAATEDRVPAGPATVLQAVPSQWTINDLAPEFPTAQASLLDAAATADSDAKVPGLGLGTWVQATPSQWRISVPIADVATPVLPTAQASVADLAAIPLSESLLPGFGLGTRFQACPSQ